MTVLELRKSAQLTLPAEIRDALQVAEGDYLEAELVEVRRDHAAARRGS